METKINLQLESEFVSQTNPTKDGFLQKLLAASALEYGHEACDKWLSCLEVFSQSESEIILAAPSKFLRDWIIREFVDVKSDKKSLKKIAESLAPKLKKLAIIFVAKNVESLEPNSSISISNPQEKVVNLSRHDNVFAFGTELNSRYTFANFVSAKYNKLAVSMAKIAAGIDAQINLFEDKIPLFIHGGVGMGKTHLAQAIAWQIKEQDRSKKVVYLSAEKFMYHFVQSIRSNDVMSFKEKMRSIDVLIVDDVQFIAGKESTQQEFMNSFNALVEENKQVVLVCDRCPSDLNNIDEKLKSRISGGMVVNFKNPDYADRLEILRLKAKASGQEVCEKTLSFVAEKVKTSVRDLDGALKKMLAAKILDEQEINIESAKTVLADYVRSSNSAAPTIEKIQKLVADFYGIKISDLTSANRSRAIARPRQVAMYLSKNHTSESLPKIGEKFGGKNHATVIHSVKLIADLMKSEDKMLREIKELEEKIC